MPSFATMTIVAHLGRDPETRHTPKGTQITSLSLPVDNPRDKEQTTWWRCSCFGRTAEIAAEYLSKGSLVAVTGTPTVREYEHNGEKRWSAELNVSELRLMGGRGEKSGTTSRPQREAAGGDFDDSIPF